MMRTYAGQGDAIHSVGIPGFVALDFETADHGPDSACSVGMVRVEDGIEIKTLYTLIRPPRRKVVFTYIHGLRWQDLCDADVFHDVWPAMAELVSDVDYLVAHNARFDKRVLTACLAGADRENAIPPFLCTLKGARAAIPDLRHYRLDDVCRHFGIPLGHHHNALDDALACARITVALLRQGMTPDRMLL